MPEVETSRDGAVLTATLNRPDVLNALNAATHASLASSLKEARAELVHALGVNPNDQAARELLSRINQLVSAPALGYGTGERPPTPPPGSPAGRGP